MKLHLINKHALVKIQAFMTRDTTSG